MINWETYWGVSFTVKKVGYGIRCSPASEAYAIHFERTVMSRQF